MTRGMTVSEALHYVSKHVRSGSCTMEDLIAAVAADRGRPINIVTTRATPVGVTGYYLSQTEQDWFFCQPGLRPGHRDAVLAHELGHLLLGHANTSPADPPLNAVSPTLAARVLRRDGSQGYTDTQERSAELFATHLLVEFDKHGGDALNELLV